MSLLSDPSLEIGSRFRGNVGDFHMEPRPDLVHEVYKPQTAMESLFVFECGHGNNAGLNLLKLKESFEQAPEAVRKAYLESGDERVRDEWERMKTGNSHHFIDHGAAQIMRELAMSFREPDNQDLMKEYVFNALMQLQCETRDNNLSELLIPREAFIIQEEGPGGLPVREGFETKYQLNQIPEPPCVVQKLSRVAWDYNRNGEKGEPTAIALPDVGGVPIIGNRVSNDEIAKRGKLYDAPYKAEVNDLIAKNSYEKQGKMYRPCLVSVHSFTPYKYDFKDGRIVTDSRHDGKIGILSRDGVDSPLAKRFIELLQHDPLLERVTGIKNDEIKLNWPYNGNKAKGATGHFSPENGALLIEFRSDLLADNNMRFHMVRAVRRALRYIATYEPDLFYRPVNQNRPAVDLDRRLIA